MKQQEKAKFKLRTANLHYPKHSLKVRKSIKSPLHSFNFNFIIFYFFAALAELADSLNIDSVHVHHHVHPPMRHPSQPFRPYFPRNKREATGTILEIYKVVADIK